MSAQEAPAPSDGAVPRPAAELQPQRPADERGTAPGSAPQQHEAPSALPAAELPPLPPLPPGPGQEAARIIRLSCDLLALPTRVASTALMFLRRVAPAQLPPERMASACVFLAAKVEEASVRTNDMLNAVAAWRLAASCSRSMSGGEAGANGRSDRAAAGSPAAAAGQAAAAGTAGPASDAAPAAAGSNGQASDGVGASNPATAAAVAAFPLLVGEAYAAAKRQLILDEQLLLRLLRFDIGADQPHKHLYALAHVWGVGKEPVRAATCLLNDAVAHCPAYGTPALPPATAAAAALHVGSELAGFRVRPQGWWRAVGISDADMGAACGALLDLLQVP